MSTIRHIHIPPHTRPPAPQSAVHYYRKLHFGDARTVGDVAHRNRPVNIHGPSVDVRPPAARADDEEHHRSGTLAMRQRVLDGAPSAYVVSGAQPLHLLTNSFLARLFHWVDR